jgi:hypothetical protein
MKYSTAFKSFYNFYSFIEFNYSNFVIGICIFNIEWIVNPLMLQAAQPVGANNMHYSPKSYFIKFIKKDFPTPPAPLININN